MLKLLLILLSFADVRALADSGVSVVESEAVLEGVVISSPSHPNLEIEEQTSFRSLSHAANRITAYIQSPDGSFGFRLRFLSQETDADKLTRYSRVRISLQGARLQVDGPCYSIVDIPEGAVLEVTPGRREAIPVKTRRVQELKPEDMYTWVSIPDAEFAFKDGAYLNVYEKFACVPSGNKTLGGNGYMGNWQTLLCDADASPFYVIMDTRLGWRRSGNGVPKGRGTVEGILVKTYLPRYGEVYAPQLRVLEEGNFGMARTEDSSFGTLCEWNWNDNRKEFRTDAGEVERLTTEKVLPDAGKGELYVDFTASTYRGLDCNNPAVESADAAVLGPYGYVRYGSMQVRTKAANWWNWGDDCGNSVVVKFSTEGLQGDRLFLAFSFAAGSLSASNTRMCPVYWGVEVSTDDVHMTRVDAPDITLRSLPWSSKEIEGVRYTTSCEAGLGLTEHIVALPSSLFGQKEVYVRISPVRKNAGTLSWYNSDRGCLRPNLSNWTSIEFGTIAIRYR